jgi:ferredoxin
MDVAYDHIQEETFPEDDEGKRKQSGSGTKEDEAPQSINDDFQDAYKAFTASPWGAKLGGFWASAKKQVRAFP